MAKKQSDLSNIFKKTENVERVEVEQDNSDLDQGNVRPSGVGLRQGEINALDEMAGRLGVSRNALMRWGIRWFILEYRAGNLDLGQYVETPPPPKKQLKLPGEE